MNLDDLIATAQPRTEKVRICARGDLVAAHQEAVAALADATRGDDSLSGAPVELAQRVKDIEDEQESSTVTFTLRSVSRQKWADLLRQYPASKEERRAGQDSDRFIVAAVAACVTDPPMSLAQAGQLAERIPTGEWNKLYMAALGLNVTETPHPKLAAATELAQVNGRSSTTPPNAESLEDGSLAGSGGQ